MSFCAIRKERAKMHSKISSPRCFYDKLSPFILTSLSKPTTHRVWWIFPPAHLTPHDPSHYTSLRFSFSVFREKLSPASRAPHSWCKEPDFLDPKHEGLKTTRPGVYIFNDRPSVKTVPIVATTALDVFFRLRVLPVEILLQIIFQCVCVVLCTLWTRFSPMSCGQV